MPFFNTTTGPKTFNITTRNLVWVYKGPKTNVKSNPEKVYAQLSADAEKLIADIIAGEPSVLREFEYSVPGNRSNWKLPEINDRWNGDDMKYDTPELRKMLAKEVSKLFPKMFSRNPYARENVDTLTTEQRLENLIGYVPEATFTKIIGKYATLKNVDKNTDKNARNMSMDQIITDAEADVKKLKTAVEKYFASAKPVIDNDYGRAGLDYDKKIALKSIPTTKQLADARFKKANVIKKVSQTNPIVRSVAKLAIRKNPRVINENATFKKMIMKNK